VLDALLGEARRDENVVGVVLSARVAVARS
jgi:hypothetical protein